MRFYVTDTSNLKNAVSFQISSHDKQPEYAIFSMLAKNIFSCKYEISKTKYYVSKDGYKESFVEISNLSEDGCRIRLNSNYSDGTNSVFEAYMTFDKNKLPVFSDIFIVPK